MAEYSSKVLCKPHRWHIQQAGNGPMALLIHGAGGATQSWRGLFPILSRDFRVIAIDLPGQGFSESGAKRRSGLEHMAEDLAGLLDHQGWDPRVIVGHSAGAAIALQMALTRPVQHIIGINAALSNFQGMAGWLFPLMAKALSANPLTARMFSATSTEASVARLISGTGSTLSESERAHYVRLAQDASHVDGTLAMMAQWSLDELIHRFPNIQAKVDLVVGTADLAVPPQTSADAVAALPNATFHQIDGLGHLAHEEDPDQIAGLIRSIVQAA